MKANEIQIGKIYLAKVSNKPAYVKVLAERQSASGRTQWQCVNTETQRKVLVKSPQRFRREAAGSERQPTFLPTTNPEVKLERNVQAIADRLVYDHGQRLVHREFRQARLAEVGLTDAQVPQAVWDRAERHCTDRLLKSFRNGATSGRTMDTPAARDDNRSSTRAATTRRNVMQVSENDARRLLQAMGAESGRYDAEQLQRKLNHVEQHVGDTLLPPPAGTQEHDLYQSIRDALGEGEQIEVASSVEAVEVPAVAEVVTESEHDETICIEEEASVAAVTPRNGRQAKAKTKPSKVGRPAKAKKQAKVETGMSGLDAAAKVLQEAGKPLNRKEVLEAILAKGYWSSPNGRTPEDTLKAAMLTEIHKKGRQSRFKKAGRGLFAAR